MNKGKVYRLEERLKRAKDLIIIKKGEEPYNCNNETFNTLEDIKQKYRLRDEEGYTLINVNFV